ncbi:protein-disulfide reductase DsbD [Ectothiorhodospiraceae bacterium 2226]|nr:protein-disulfide reductase DsbD [Ectothiorhodospiraceae bacterium 2226]
MAVLCLVLATGFAAGVGAQEDELLDPDEAFALEVEAVDANTVRATWTIADGYYMYRERFKFETDTQGVRLGEPNIPPGKVTTDEFFGEVETYRNSVAVEIPVEREQGASDTFTLLATSQGCADLGVCYPPHRQEVEVTLAAADGAAAPRAPPAAAETPAQTQPQQRSNPLAALSRLGDRLGLQSQDDFLDPDDAFRFTVQPDGDALVVDFQIADGYYLYREQFKFNLKDADGARLGEPQLPEGKAKEDEFFGKTEVYYNAVQVRLPVQGASSADAALLEATFQGCADAGICYPPMTREARVDLAALTGEAPAAQAAPAQPTTPAQAPAAAPAETDAPPLSEQDRIAASLADGRLWLNVLVFFGLGLLLAFTPCVFPMIPILSSIIAGQGATITTRRAFTMSLVFVLAMAVTYTIAGVLAGLFGANLQATFQNPWILGTFALIFVLLSLAMFGFYNLQLPSALQSKLAEVSNRQQGGTLVGVGIMGFLSALIVGPCVAAPLMGALIYIGQTGDAVLGGAALFAMSLGMGVPLLAIGTSAGKLLPKAGPWMDAIKAVFGVLLLAVAIWLVERVLPATVALLLWASLFIIAAIYMGALEPIREGASGWRRLWKGIGWLLILWGVLMLIGAALGGRGDLLQPMRDVGFAGGGGAAVQAQQVEFQKVKSVEDVQRAVAASAQAGRPVMLDFYADWCVDCIRMERTTFRDQGVIQAMSNFTLLKADVTANDAQDRELLRHFGLIGPPMMLFFDSNGEEMRNYRVVGYMDAANFRPHLERAAQR